MCPHSPEETYGQGLYSNSQLLGTRIYITFFPNAAAKHHNQDNFDSFIGLEVPEHQRSWGQGKGMALRMAEGSHLQPQAGGNELNDQHRSLLKP